jgi:hypothetical protein
MSGFGIQRVRQCEHLMELDILDASLKVRDRRSRETQLLREF